MKTQLQKLNIHDDMTVYQFLQQLPDENGYHNAAYGLSYPEFQAWLVQMEDYSKGLKMPDWMVPSTEYWFIVDEAELEKMRMYGIFTETRAVSTVIGKLRWSLNRQAHIIVVYWSV